MNGCDGCCYSGGCGVGCGHVQKKLESYDDVHPMSSIHRVIGITGGKGGVGTSTIVSALAVLLRQRGCRVGILDSDFAMGSISRMFGLKKELEAAENGVFPLVSKTGIQVMSLRLSQEEQQAVWRETVQARVFAQVWKDTIWGKIDYLLVDIPPGTGEVPQWAFQRIPIDTLIMVTMPQKAVAEAAKYALREIERRGIPLLGLIENFSFFTNDGAKVPIFGGESSEELALEHAAPILAKIPLDQNIARLADEGRIEELSLTNLEPVTVYLEASLLHREERM